jgi:transcriptional regulator with XRE-family HTH domain
VKLSPESRRKAVRPPRRTEPRAHGRAEERTRPEFLVDGVRPLAVDTAAVGVPARSPAGSAPVVAAPSVMEKEHFGSFLRRARETRNIALSDVAHITKVSRSVLELLEQGELDRLPPVYARGFIRSFARAVGIDETEPLFLYERAIEARSTAEKARSATPVPDAPELLGGATEDETMTPRRGLGLAVFVIILLLIATITLSLLLRRPPPLGEGLSLLRGPASTVAAGPAPAST